MCAVPESALGFDAAPDLDASCALPPLSCLTASRLRPPLSCLLDDAPIRTEVDGEDVPLCKGEGLLSRSR